MTDEDLRALRKKWEAMPLHQGMLMSPSRLLEIADAASKERDEAVAALALANDELRDVQKDLNATTAALEAAIRDRDLAREFERIGAERARVVMAEEAARWHEKFDAENPSDFPSTELAASSIRALAPLPPSLRLVEACHICGSSDAALTERVGLCSRGHLSDPARLPGNLVALDVETIEKVKAAIETMLASAHPHPVEHKAMTRAWEIGRAALALLVKP